VATAPDTDWGSFKELGVRHMRVWRRKLIFASLVVAPWLLASPLSAADDCDLSKVKSAAALHEMLSRRAVEVVERASRAGYGTDRRLAQLVDPSASFNLGAGDVGRPLGNGVAGARSLADTMHPNSFRFDGWNYMDMPVDGCSTQEVTVEFIDAPGKESSLVKFTFQAGRVVSGTGWARFFESGRLDLVEEHH
jgi:hypothetical protein